MRFSIVSLTALIGVVSSAAIAASCSSKSNGGANDDGGMGSSSSGAGSGGDAAEEPAPVPCGLFSDDAGLTSPVVSFKNDVLPLFEHSCGLSGSCHGEPTDVAQRGIFLGCDINSNAAGCATSNSMPCQCDQTNPGPQVYAGLVASADAGAEAGAVSTPLEETCMPFITPGDPTKSYLMHKVDGDECTLTCCIPQNMAVTAAEIQEEGLVLPDGGSGWCGQFMPYNVALLPTGPVCGGTATCSAPASAARDTIRAWIAQGALNN
jgi:hypothetical protein